MILWKRFYLAAGTHHDDGVEPVVDVQGALSDQPDGGWEVPSHILRLVARLRAMRRAQRQRRSQVVRERA